MSGVRNTFGIAAGEDKKKKKKKQIKHGESGSSCVTSRHEHEEKQSRLKKKRGQQKAIKEARKKDRARVYCLREGEVSFLCVFALEINIKCMELQHEPLSSFHCHSRYYDYPQHHESDKSPRGSFIVVTY